MMNKTDVCMSLYNLESYPSLFTIISKTASEKKRLLPVTHNDGASITDSQHIHCTEQECRVHPSQT